MRDIAAEAGMLPGSLHYRYATKDALLVALMEAGMRRAIETVRGAVSTGRDLWDGLLGEAIDAGLLRPGVDQDLVRLLLLGAVNWSAQWFDPGSNRSPESAAEAFLAVAAAGLLAPSREGPVTAWSMEASLARPDLGPDGGA